MSTTPASQPVIVIRKKKGGHGHHGGAWKVAYADFVTAMMALFIVLWLLSADQEVQKAVGGYFRDPSGSGKMMGSSQAGSGEALSVSKDDMSKLKQEIEQAMREVPKFDAAKDNVEITVTNDGLRIELLEKEGGLFFDSGSAALTPKGSELVALLARQLNAMPNSILIEGHTDARPYTSDKGYTNWELSADRANAARRLLIENGVPPSKIAQIRGFADQQLRFANQPEDPRNRRISVIVQYRHLSAGGTAPAPAAPPGSAPNGKAAH
jgi:chemotaxis protein MotB